MTVTVSDVMRRVRNYFVMGYADDTWTLEGGVLSPGTLHPGDWVAITGAGSMSGVYQVDIGGTLPIARSQTWTGRIWRLAPPEDFLRLCGEIAEWAESHPDPTTLSEHFGQYSRSGSSTAWERVFAARLQPYVRMFSEVKC